MPKAAAQPSACSHGSFRISILYFLFACSDATHVKPILEFAVILILHDEVADSVLPLKSQVSTLERKIAQVRRSQALQEIFFCYWATSTGCEKNRMHAFMRGIKKLDANEAIYTGRTERLRKAHRFASHRLRTR